ncbi:MAG TPA: hypothetical protein VD927_13730 [Chryseosolibacter sp.]|nr:hypothetical protein [Chryseosolibacter sp.]
MITTAVKSRTSSQLDAVWLTLKLTFGLVPIVAGLDKFTNILVDWSQYVSPGFAQMLPMSTETFMIIVGVIEIAAGVIVLVKTELGAYIVAAWLLCIALSLIASWTYVDVAVRDIVMAIGAFSLARLTVIRNND